MDVYIVGLLLIGLLLLAVTWCSEWIARLPLSYALIYLVIGVALGPYGIKLIQIQPDTRFLERFTELVVIVSLFSCGLKMNRPLRLWAWNSTIRLIGILMPLSIFAIALLSHWALGFGWGEAVLLGAILAPTDPVLASEVQLEHRSDPDELRFGLTSEGGLNDALAFPFVYFGLYWITKPNFDSWFRQWVIIDLFWAILAGIGVGMLVAQGVVWISEQLHRAKAVSQIMSDLIAIGTILLAYSLTELVNGYGFLAVFIAGVVVQKRCHAPDKLISQLSFVTQIEKLLEVAAILLLGSLLRLEQIAQFLPATLVIAGSLLFILRPLSAWISTMGDQLRSVTRILFGWFGIRGIGSIYYLSYAISHGVSGAIAGELRWITYLTVLISIVLHGISAGPLMIWYGNNIGESRLPSKPS